MPSSFLSSISNTVSGISKLTPADLTNVPKIMSSVVSFTDSLEQASFGLLYFKNYSLRVSLLDFFSALLVCYRFRNSIKTKKSWFEVLISCTLTQFGGTTLTGLLLGQTPSWILSHGAFPALLLAYWLTFCAPKDFFWKHAKKFMVPLQIGAIINSGFAVTTRGLDKAYYNTFHTNYVRISESMLTCLLSGTFSGSGGGLLSDIFGFLRNPSYTLTQTTSIFSEDNYAVTSALTRSFFLATLYYILITPYFSLVKGPMLKPAQGHFVIVVLQLLNFACMELYNYDFYTKLSIHARKLFRIPNAIEPMIEVGEKGETATPASSKPAGKPLTPVATKTIPKKVVTTKGGSCMNDNIINSKYN